MITIIHPNRHSRSIEVDGEKLQVPFVDGQQLTVYLRNSNLSGLRKHCRIEATVASKYFSKVRGSYVPKDGDVIRLRRVGSIQ